MSVPISAGQALPCPKGQSRVTQRQRSSALIHLPTHECVPGFSRPGQHPVRSASLCSLLLRWFGSPIDPIPARPENTAVRRYGTPLGCCGNSWGCPPSCLSAPTFYFLVTIKVNASPCRMLGLVHNVLAELEQGARQPVQWSGCTLCPAARSPQCPCSAPC